MSSPTRPRRHAVTVLELVVVVAIIGIVTGLLLSAVQRARWAAARLKCQNNLRQIALALHHHHDALRALPPGMSYRGGSDHLPMLSWRSRLFPFIDQEALWRTTLRAYDLDRDYFKNPPHTAFSTPIPIFGCPLDERVATPFVVGRFPIALSSYLGVSGENHRTRNGVLYLDSAVRLTDIRDGTSQTLMVGERPPSADGHLGWSYAADGLFRDGTADLVLGTREVYDELSSLPCFRGSVYHFARGDLENPCDSLRYWSFHESGANFAFADGSVRFLRYTIEPIMPALATRAGREVVTIPD